MLKDRPGSCGVRYRFVLRRRLWRLGKSERHSDQEGRLYQAHLEEWVRVINLKGVEKEERLTEVLRGIASC
jgi:hypothetical protein